MHMCVYIYIYIYVYSLSIVIIVIIVNGIHMPIRTSSRLTILEP